MAKKSMIDNRPSTGDLPEWSISAEYSVDDMRQEAKPAAKPAATTIQNQEFVLGGNVTSPTQSNNAYISGNVNSADTVISSPYVNAGTNDGLLDMPQARMQPGMQPMQPGMQPMQPMMQQGMQPMQPGMQQMQPMQQGMQQMQPGMQPMMQQSMQPMQPGMQQMQQGMQQMQPGMQQMQPGMQPMQQGVQGQSAPAMERISRPEMRQPVQNQSAESITTAPTLEQMLGAGSVPSSQGQDSFTAPTLGQLLEPTAEQPVQAQSAQPAGGFQQEQERSQTKESPGNQADPNMDWQQSEHALSEAAAMLYNITMEHEEEEVDDIRSLRRGLDNITASLNRLNASVREDMADVIEQTQRDDDLSEAVQVEQILTQSQPAAQSSSVPVDEPIVNKSEVPNMVQSQPAEQSSSVPVDESIVNGEVDKILEMYRTLEQQPAAVSPESENATGVLEEEPVFVEQETVPETKTVVMKTLAPLDESSTSGMNVNGIAELHKRQSDTSTPRKKEKALKSKTKTKAPKEPVQEEKFEEEVFDDLVQDEGFHFVVDKGIVENPVEWQMDLSFQNDGQKQEEAVEIKSDYEEAQTEEEVITVTDVEDQLKKREVEVKRSRAEKSRLQNNSGFAYALSDLNQT